MDDTISRRAAIEALKEAFNPSITNFVKAKIAIDKLPPVQPERDAGYSDGFADGYIAGKKDAPAITDPCSVCKWDGVHPWSVCEGCKAEGVSE